MSRRSLSRTVTPAKGIPRPALADTERRPARSLARLFPLGSDRGRHTLAGLGRRRQGDRMRRREFIALLGAAVIASSRDVIAQRTERVRRIGMLVNLAESDPQGRSRVTAFRRGLDELGWTEGRNLQVEYDWAAGSAARMRALAKELVERQPELIVCET